MINNHFIFLTGLHRSGTSLLHSLLREHPDISGFANTGVPEDEGQHLQTVVKTAKHFGGPGKFAFRHEAYMNEYHTLATKKNAQKILLEWKEYFDLSCKFLIEKSPPTIIRTRFFQKLFPKSRFIILLRHPLVVAYATQKWSKTSIISLLNHTLYAYKIFFNDLSHLNSFHIIRYEDLVQEPQNQIDNILNWLDINICPINQKVNPKVNEKYFKMWENDRGSMFADLHDKDNQIARYDKEMRRFGYSINNYRECV